MFAIFPRHVSKVLHLPRKSEARSSEVLHLKIWCRIPCACHTKRHLNVQKCSEPVSCYIMLLTSKCASRHNGVLFLNISTSKSALNVVCFVHFDFEMPQRRTFSTSQLPKVLRTRQFLTLLTSKCASRHNGLDFLKVLRNLTVFNPFDFQM